MPSQLSLSIEMLTFFQESSSLAQPDIHFEERPKIFPDFPDSSALPVDATQFDTVTADGTNPFAPSPRLRGSGKLRKAPHLDQLLPEPSETDKDKLKQEKKAKKEREKQEKLAAREKEKEKKARDAQDRGRASSAEDEDKKKGFMRFRLKSRERKTPENGPTPMPEDSVPSLPIIPKEPAILPIAGKFTRDADDVSLSEPPRDSQSSNGFDTDSYRRPRARGSRYERPHPAWRTSYTTGLSSRSLDKEEPESVLPLEIHTLPPGQTLGDPSRRPSQPIVDEASQEVQPSVDPEIIRQYYGLPPPTPTPAPVETEVPERSHSPTFANFTPFAQKSSQQSLKLTTTNLSPKGSPPRSSPTKATPPDLSPYLVPSPGPTQHTFNTPTTSKQPIASVAKRGGIQFVVPPPVIVGLPLPRRANDPNVPPPTPPPTTGLPPTPPEADPRLLSPNPPSRVPSPRSPGANSPYGRSMLSSRATSPALRPSSPSVRVPSPGSRSSSPFRPPGTAAAGIGGSQRGKASPFPTRPLVKPNGTGNYLLNRRVDASVPVSPLRSAKGSFTDVRMFDGRYSEEYEDLVVRVHAGLEDPPHANLAPFSRRDTRRSRDGVRRSTNTGGYESDGAETESRHSRDTYYGRNTLYSRDGGVQFAFFDEKEREEAMRQMPTTGDIRRAGLGDIEYEREQGRERLVRLLAQGTNNRF